jgi:hypothetical protein
MTRTPALRPEPRRPALRALSFALAAALLAAGGAEARPRHHPSPDAAAACSDSEHYANVSGHCVHRPIHAARRPAGASAQCRDGSFSFSEHHRGTCSHHGGVAQCY